MRHLICALLFGAYGVFAMAALDLNSAGVAELDALPGVGPSRAQAIVDYRTAHGPFRTVDELAGVKGIGDKTLAELRPLLTVVPAGRATVTPAVAVDVPNAPGLPWVWLVGGVVVAVVAFVFLRRRKVSLHVPPVQAQPEPAQMPGSPRRAVADTLPRPASATQRSGSDAAAPPRPAGSTPVAPANEGTAPVSATQPPKTAGGPPKPAGSR